ncbi:Gram-negative bacterial tonB protein [Tsuneonella dongtanensis]|uniref:Gram-negative bacterial tonB protein n=1 Tax=Tsuneonella dongtanensis TaxID=692370 RepID=A0A1B2AD92_9SPHN|nr:energy transducer TonB [Tsuneonella dongtanensis]ANY20094.1 Gram-negative bacterial tonB protein [Tsuneonella dongtanensis]
MAYLQNTSWKDRPGAIAGVVAIHGVIGYALITGLSFTQIIERVKNPQAVDVVVPLPVPPPEPPKPQPDEAVIDRPIVAPKPLIDVSPVKPVIDTTPIIIPTPDIQPRVIPSPTPAFTPAARPAFDPVGAKPKNNPGNWVTVNDYRSSWINREWTGTARFRLQVGANGRVESCTITSSSGHPELDQATCALVTQRARFDPAKDEAGAKTTGSYSNSVRWELPE